MYNTFEKYKCGKKLKIMHWKEKYNISYVWNVPCGKMCKDEIKKMYFSLLAGRSGNKHRHVLEARNKFQNKNA